MEIKEINKILSNLSCMISDYGKNPYNKVLDTRDGTCSTIQYGKKGGLFIKQGQQKHSLELQ